MISNVKGKNILMEDLRQYCLHQNLKEQGNEAIWWDYMKYVHQECFGYISKKCSEDGHKQIGVNMGETDDCIYDSFGRPGRISGNIDWNKINYKSESSIMLNNTEAWTAYGTLYWPSVTINQVTFRGDITPENILEAVCAGLKDKPDVCIKFYREENIDFSVPLISNSVTKEMLIVVVVVLVGVNVLLLLAYRRCAKREMEQDIGIQVSSAVSQYIQLSQQKQGNTSIEQ